MRAREDGAETDWRKIEISIADDARWDEGEGRGGYRYVGRRRDLHKGSNDMLGSYQGHIVVSAVCPRRPMPV